MHDCTKRQDKQSRIRTAFPGTWLIARDADTGLLQWTKRLPRSDNKLGVVAAHGHVYSILQPDALRVYSGQSGDLVTTVVAPIEAARWQYLAIYRTTLVGLVTVSAADPDSPSQSWLLGFDVAGLDLKWKFSARQVVAPPAVKFGQIQATIAVAAGRVTFLDRGLGSCRWILKPERKCGSTKQRNSPLPAGC